MEIETKRLLLRNFVQQDLEDVFAYCNQEDVGKMAGWSAHQRKEDTEKVLTNWVKNEDQFAIVLKENHKVIGHISINKDSEEDREDTKELGCALNHDYQHRGIMREAMLAAMNFVFYGGVTYLWACCFQENTPSKRLIEGCGFIFQQDGTFYSKSLDRTFQSHEYRISKEEWSRQCGAGSATAIAGMQIT